MGLKVCCLEKLPLEPVERQFSRVGTFDLDKLLPPIRINELEVADIFADLGSVHFERDHDLPLVALELLRLDEEIQLLGVAHLFDRIIHDSVVFRFLGTVFASRRDAPHRFYFFGGAKI